MKQLAETSFNDFENPQLIWEIYGELLDLYTDQNFSAKQIAYETHSDTKLINRVLHRLIQFKAVKQTHCDIWGIKQYSLNPEFTN